MLQLATKGILFHPSLPYKGIIPTVRSIPPVVIITSDNGGRSYYGRYGKNKELKTRNINIYIKWREEKYFISQKVTISDNIKIKTDKFKLKENKDIDKILVEAKIKTFEK